MYFKILNKMGDVKQKLYHSLMGVLGIAVAVYIFTLLSIVVTAIDLKHIIVSIGALDKSTLALERDYALKVSHIEESQLTEMGYDKVSSSFVVRMDTEANFSLLYGQ